MGGSKTKIKVGNTLLVVANNVLSTNIESGYYCDYSF